MKVKKSRFIKFFILVLVCVFGFFGVNNIMVNADSIWNYGDVNLDDGDSPDNYMMSSHFNWDSFYLEFELADIEAVAGGNDTLVWFSERYENESQIMRDYMRFYNSHVPGDGGSFEISRTIDLNEQKSNDDLLYYDCTINEIAGDVFIFEKNDFFMRLDDLSSDRLPIIKFLQTNVNVSMEIDGYILDKNGNARELSLVRPNKSLTSNSAFYLYPNKYELFGNIDFDEVYSSNAIMYISNYRCLIEISSFPFTCNYHYSVQSVNDEELRYGTIFTDYVNAVSSSDIVGGVADNVNSFLQIEILPGLSFFGILLLAIAVPMLIWILKIFFGG